MIQRQCPECNGELVQARRTENQPGSAMVTGLSNYWRCSTCGSAFTAEQVRDAKRPKLPKPTSLEHA